MATNSLTLDFAGVGAWVSKKSTMGFWFHDIVIFVHLPGTHDIFTIPLLDKVRCSIKQKQFRGAVYNGKGPRSVHGDLVDCL